EVDDLTSERIALAREGEHPLERERTLIPSLGEAIDRPRDGLAAKPAGVDPIIRRWVIEADRQVADLPREPTGPTIQLAVDDEAEPHATSDPEVREVVAATTVALPELAERREVDVVLDVDVGAIEL